MAVQIYSGAVFSVSTELLRSNDMKLISKSINYERKRGNDLFIFFWNHPNFEQYNAAYSGVIYVGFPSFFQPDFEIFEHQVTNRACILAIKKQLISVHVISI